MAPKIAPKLIKKGYLWGPFLDFVFSGFGALWVPLGSLLGFFEAILGGLGPQKPWKNIDFSPIGEALRVLMQ